MKFFTRSASYPKGELRSVCKVPRTQSAQELLPVRDVSLAQASNLGAHHSLVVLFISALDDHGDKSKNELIGPAGGIVSEDEIVDVVCRRPSLTCDQLDVRLAGCQLLGSEAPQRLQTCAFTHEPQIVFGWKITLPSNPGQQGRALDGICKGRTAGTRQIIWWGIYKW